MHDLCVLFLSRVSGVHLECQVGSPTGPKRIRSCAEVTKDLAKINEHRSGFQPGNEWPASKITETRVCTKRMNTSVLDIVVVIRIVCDSPQQRIEVAQLIPYRLSRQFIQLAKQLRQHLLLRYISNALTETWKRANLELLVDLLGMFDNARGRRCGTLHVRHAHAYLAGRHTLSQLQNLFDTGSGACERAQIFNAVLSLQWWARKRPACRTRPSRSGAR